MIKLTCKCTSCGVDQSKAWGEELGKWYSGALADVEARRNWLEREEARIEQRELVVRQGEQVAQKSFHRQTNDEDRVKHYERQLRDARAELQRTQGELKKAKADQAKAKKLIRGLRSGRIDPYELLIPISKTIGCDRSEIEPDIDPSTPVNGEFLW